MKKLIAVILIFATLLICIANVNAAEAAASVTAKTTPTPVESATTIPKDDIFQINENCAISIGSTFDPKLAGNVRTGLQVVQFAEAAGKTDVGKAAQTYIEDTAKSTSIPGFNILGLPINYNFVADVLDNPITTTVAKQLKKAIYSGGIKLLSETAGQVVGTAVDSCTNIGSKIIATPGQTKKAAETTLEKNEAKTELNGIIKNKDNGAGKFGQEIFGSQAKPEDFQVIAKDGTVKTRSLTASTAKTVTPSLTTRAVETTDVPAETNGQEFTFEEGGFIILKEKIKINADKGAKVVYDKNTGTITLSKGNIEFPGVNYLNLENAKIVLNPKDQIIYMEAKISDSCENAQGKVPCEYAFTHNGVNYNIFAGKDSHIIFDPTKKKEQIQGDGDIIYLNQKIDGKFTVDIGLNGKILAVHLLTKDSYYIFDDTKVTAYKDKEPIDIYFDGEDISGKRNAISFSADRLKTALQGNVELLRCGAWNIQDETCLKKEFDMKGNTGTVAEILRHPAFALESISLKKGDLNVDKGGLTFNYLNGKLKYSRPTGSNVDETSSEVVVDFEGKGYADIPSKGNMLVGTIVQGTKEKIGFIESDVQKYRELGPDKFLALVQLRAEILSAIGDTAKLEKLAAKNQDLIEKIPELKGMIESGKKAVKLKEVSNEVEKITNDLSDMKITTDGAVQKLLAVNKKYSFEFKNEIQLAIANIYDKSGDTKSADNFRILAYKEKYIPELEKYILENPKDIDARFKLASFYNYVGDPENSKKDLENVIYDSNLIISANPSNSAELRDARLNKASALRMLGNYNDAKKEFNYLLIDAQKTNDQENMRIARLGLGIVKTEQNMPEEAIGDFAALEKISEGDMKLFATRMTKSLKLKAYNKFEKDSDKNKESAIGAQRFLASIKPEELKEELNDIESDLKTLGNGKVPELLDERFKSYKKTLQEVQSQMQYSGLTQEEVGVVVKKEEEIKLAPLKEEFEKRNAELKQKLSESKISYAGFDIEIKKIKKETLEKNELYKELSVRRELGMKELETVQNPEYRYYITSELEKIDKRLAEKDAFVTGQTDVRLIGNDIPELQAKLQEMEKTAPWLTRQIAKIPVIGGFKFLTGEYGGEKTRLEEEINEKSELRIETFKSQIAKTADPNLKIFDYNTGDYVSIWDVVNREEKAAYDYGKQKALEIGITAFSGGVGKIFTGTLLKGGEMIAAKYAVTQAGKMMVMKTASFAAGALEPAIFHTANNLLTIGTGGEADWSVGAYASTFVTLKMLSAGNKIMPIKQTTAFSRTIAPLNRLLVGTISFTAMQSADSMIRGGSFVKDPLSYVLNAGAENAMFVGGLELGSAYTAYKQSGASAKTVSEMKAVESRLTEINKENLNIKANAEAGRISEAEAKQKVTDNLKTSQVLQLDYVKKYSGEIERLKKEGFVSNNDYNRIKKSLEASESIINYNKAELEASIAYENVDKFSSTEKIAKADENLINAKESRIQKNLGYINELEKQAKELKLDTDFVSNLKSSYESEIKELNDQKSKLEASKASPAEIEKLNAKTAPPESILTIGKKVLGISLSEKEMYAESRWNLDTGRLDKALEGFQKILDKNPSAEVEKKALAGLATASEKKAKTEQTIDYLNKLIERYPEDLLSDTARIKLAGIYESQGKIELAIKQFEKLAERKIVTQEAADAKIAELSTMPAAGITTEKIIPIETITTAQIKELELQLATNYKLSAEQQTKISEFLAKNPETAEKYLNDLSDNLAFSKPREVDNLISMTLQENVPIVPMWRSIRAVTLEQYNQILQESGIAAAKQGEIVLGVKYKGMRFIVEPKNLDLKTIKVTAVHETGHQAYLEFGAKIDAKLENGWSNIKEQFKAAFPEYKSLETDAKIKDEIFSQWTEASYLKSRYKEVIFDTKKREFLDMIDKRMDKEIRENLVQDEFGNQYGTDKLLKASRLAVVDSVPSTVMNSIKMENTAFEYGNEIIMQKANSKAVQVTDAMKKSNIEFTAEGRDILIKKLYKMEEGKEKGLLKFDKPGLETDYIVETMTSPIKTAEDSITGKNIEFSSAVKEQLMKKISDITEKQNKNLLTKTVAAGDIEIAFRDAYKQEASSKIYEIETRDKSSYTYEIKNIMTEKTVGIIMDSANGKISPEEMGRRINTEAETFKKLDYLEKTISGQPRLTSSEVKDIFNRIHDGVYKDVESGTKTDLEMVRSDFMRSRMTRSQKLKEAYDLRQSIKIGQQPISIPMDIAQKFSKNLDSVNNLLKITSGNAREDLYSILRKTENIDSLLKEALQLSSRKNTLGVGINNPLSTYELGRIQYQIEGKPTQEIGTPSVDFEYVKQELGKSVPSYTVKIKSESGKEIASVRFLVLNDGKQLMVNIMKIDPSIDMLKAGPQIYGEIYNKGILEKIKGNDLKNNEVISKDKTDISNVKLSFGNLEPEVEKFALSIKDSYVDKTDLGTFESQFQEQLAKKFSKQIEPQKIAEIIQKNTFDKESGRSGELKTDEIRKDLENMGLKNEKINEIIDSVEIKEYEYFKGEEFTSSLGYKEDSGTIATLARINKNAEGKYDFNKITETLKILSADELTIGRIIEKIKAKELDSQKFKEVYSEIKSEEIPGFIKNIIKSNKDSNGMFDREAIKEDLKFDGMDNVKINDIMKKLDEIEKNVVIKRTETPSQIEIKVEQVLQKTNYYERQLENEKINTPEEARALEEIKKEQEDLKKHNDVITKEESENGNKYFFDSYVPVFRNAKNVLAQSDFIMFEKGGTFVRNRWLRDFLGMRTLNTGNKMFFEVDMAGLKQLQLDSGIKYIRESKEGEYLVGPIPRKFLKPAVGSELQKLAKDPNNPKYNNPIIATTSTIWDQTGYIRDYGVTEKVTYVEEPGTNKISKEKVLRTNGHSRDIMISDAKDYLSKGDKASSGEDKMNYYDIAIDKIDGAIKLSSEKSEQYVKAMLLKAKTYDKMGNVEKAAESYERYIEKAENNPSMKYQLFGAEYESAHIYLADAYAKTGNYDKAVLMLEEFRTKASKIPLETITLKISEINTAKKFAKYFSEKVKDVTEPSDYVMNILASTGLGKISESDAKTMIYKELVQDMTSNDATTKADTLINQVRLAKSELRGIDLQLEKIIDLELQDLNAKNINLPRDLVSASVTYSFKDYSSGELMKESEYESSVKELANDVFNLYKQGNIELNKNNIKELVKIRARREGLSENQIKAFEGGYDIEYAGISNSIKDLVKFSEAIAEKTAEDPGVTNIYLARDGAAMMISDTIYEKLNGKEADSKLIYISRETLTASQEQTPAYLEKFRMFGDIFNGAIDQLSTTSFALASNEIEAKAIFMKEYDKIFTKKMQDDSSFKEMVERTKRQLEIDGIFNKEKIRFIDTCCSGTINIFLEEVMSYYSGGKIKTESKLMSAELPFLLLKPKLSGISIERIPQKGTFGGIKDNIPLLKKSDPMTTVENYLVELIAVQNSIEAFKKR